MTLNKIILLILDGWGKGEENNGNAIYLANTPFVDSLINYPHAQLLTHGENVGLPEGQMGNSEVGHINIGAGRIVYQELQRINNALKYGELDDNKVFQDLIREKKSSAKQLHLMGLVSDGGVHSHIDHFKGLIDILHQNEVGKVNIHAFTDGRDTDPKGGYGYIEDLQSYCEGKDAEIVSVIGRYYAMDRDKRWERTKLAYELLVHGEGAPYQNILAGINNSYDEGITDEFIKPIVKVDENRNPVSRIHDGDIVLFVNFRTDRPRQITECLTQRSFSDYKMDPLDLSYYTMTNYDKTYSDIKVIFEKNDVLNTLGEIVSKNGRKQIRIAETEKYPHVTFFFNGGREVEFEGEQRILVNSPKVATYDLKPEMSAYEITEAILPEIEKAEVDFVCLNFANADMVGHTGDISAAIKACEAVDSCVQQIVELGLKKGYQFLITADHGNSDYMLNEDGSPNTAHTTNPVPLYYVANDVEGIHLKNGILADLAPTILNQMSIPIPEDMTGKILLD